MKIRINNDMLDTPSELMSIREMIEWRGVSDSGTAVAVNNKLIPRLKWDVTMLNDGDDITLISAAFGG